MSSPGRQYAGKSSDDRRAERRSKLLAGGLELIGEDGVGALSVRGVCGRASLTPRYFYEEFGTLDDYARALFDREFDVGLERVGTAVAAAPPETLERVSAAVGAVLDVVTEVPARATLLLTGAAGMSVLVERRQQRMEDVITVVAAFGRTTYGGDDVPDPDAPDRLRALRQTATFVAGGLAQSVDAWLRGDIPGSRDALQADLTIQIVAAGDAASAHLEQRRATRRH